MDHPQLTHPDAKAPVVAGLHADPPVSTTSRAATLSRHELGILIAKRDGLDVSRLPTGLRADSTLPGALDVLLDSRATQRGLRTTLHSARQFLHHPGVTGQQGSP